MKFHNKFMKLIILSLITMLAVTACNPAGAGGELEPEMESVPDLEGTSWILEQFGPENAETAVLPNTTITLNFADGGVNGSAGCNNYFGEVTQTDSALAFGAIGATRMACLEDSVMQQENDYLASLGAVNSFTMQAEKLILLFENGRLIYKVGSPEETRGESETSADEDITKTLFVGPELVDCVGVAPQQCLQVREHEEDDWTLFYGQIEGFVFEPGYEYELLVTESEVANPPADASSIAVRLVDVVSQTAVATAPESDSESHDLQGTSWILVGFGPNDNQTAVLPGTELTLNFDGEQINGDAGCNSYFAEATLGDGNTLTFGLMGSTLVACLDEAVMQQESEYLAALAQVESYTLSGNRLTLHTADSALEFVTATMHESGNTADEVVDWDTAVSILNSGDVVEIFQTHSLEVTLTLADGRIIKTVEPAIDDIFAAIEECGESCSNILMSTE